MEDLPSDFFKMMDTMVKEIEEFFAEVAKDIGDVMDTIADASEEIVNQMQVTFETEIEPRISEFIDPILEAYLGFEIAIEETTQPVIHTVEPMINNHPACVGCRHYHGQMYGDTVLVCGMHPYGWDGEQCPDWESTWKE